MYLYHGSTEERLRKLFAPDASDLEDGYRPMIAVGLYVAPNPVTAEYHARVLQRHERRRNPEARGVILTLDRAWLERRGRLVPDVPPAWFTPKQREEWHQNHPGGAFVYSGPIGPYTLLYADENRSARR